MNQQFAPSSGLISLCYAAKIHHINLNWQQVAHDTGFSGIQFKIPEILVAAHSVNFKAKLVESQWEKLAHTPLPSIVVLNDDKFVLLMRAKDDRVLIFDSNKNAHIEQTREEFCEHWTNKLILLRPKLDFSEKNQVFGFAWFVPKIMQYRSELRNVLYAALCVQLLALATPLFMQQVIDKVLMHKNMSALYVYLAIMIVLMLFNFGFAHMQNYFLQHTSGRLDVQLGVTLLNHMLRLPLGYFESRRVGDTVAHVREMENIRQFFTGSTVTSVLDLLFVVVFVAVMSIYSLTLTFVVLMFGLVFVAISLVMRPLMKSALEEKFARGSENQAFLVETITGIHTIKSLAVEPVMINKWQAILTKYVTASFRANQIGAFGSNLGSTIQQFSTIAIISVGTVQVMSGGLSIGQLIAIQMLSARVIQPLVRIVQLWQEFQQVGISINRLGDIMNTQPEPTVNVDRSNLKKLQGRIQFTKVAFNYRNKSVLNNVSFTAQPDQIIAVVGRSGSGKSTLAKLLQKMYIPASGSITVDNVDIRNVDHAWLRRQIGVVLQENFLFNGTVRDNIAVHVPNPSMEQIIYAAQLAGAHEFISDLEHGYDTPIGERGMSLSGGQRQRIAIARALINNPSILIFDEATSALDYESERYIQNNLATICKGRTVFMIAHRLSTIQNADSILVMDDGSVVDSGTHAELINRKGLYHYLFSVQENHAQPSSYPRKA